MFTTDLEKMKKSKEYYKKLHEETENKVVTTENQLANGEFYITDYDNTKTFIHVFDDFSFPFVLNELDTLRDFVNYLEEKEIFIRKAKGVPQHPLKRIIAIGIEPVKYSKTTSEDIAFIDCSQWTDEQQQRFRELRNIMKIWRTPLDKATKFQAKEYPDVVSKKVGRNDPCPCQSGKKYKKCCGR